TDLEGFCQPNHTGVHRAPYTARESPAEVVPQIDLNDRDESADRGRKSEVAHVRVEVRQAVFEDATPRQRQGAVAHRNLETEQPGEQRESAGEGQLEVFRDPLLDLAANVGESGTIAGPAAVEMDDRRKGKLVFDERLRDHEVIGEESLADGLLSADRVDRDEE